jgi:hypothetical protein
MRHNVLHLKKSLEKKMPVRRQLEVMLADAPGELAKLTAIIKDEHINVEAMSIQDANEYLLALYDVRNQTGRRVAPRDYYEAILKESVNYSMIRLITDNPTKAVEVLGKAGYNVKVQEVIGLILDNKPGVLNKISRMLGDAGINIAYTYGSGFSDSEVALFIFKVSDMEKALALFPEGAP